MAQEKRDPPDPIEDLPPELDLQVVPIMPQISRRDDAILMVVSLSEINSVWLTTAKRGVS